MVGRLACGWLAVALLGGCGGGESEAFPPVDQLPSIPGPPPVLESASADDWSARRAEIAELLDHYVYGVTPESVPATGTEAAPVLDVEGGRYVEVTVRYGPAAAPPIVLGLFLPEGVSRPPVMLALNKCGNHSLTTDPRIPESTAWAAESCADESGETRGARASLFPVARILERGYALATFHESDVDPDDASDRDRSDGIHSHLPVEGDAPWGTLAAWAYGVSRAVDYLESSSLVDGARIATVGHSRRGKVALLAAARDPRIAMAIPHQSGTGGVTLSRSDGGESVMAITLFFPHWFTPGFADFAGEEARLPLDQHFLVAMVAPRPLLAVDGVDDFWADPQGARRSIELADEVWELLGSEGAVELGDGTFDLTADLAWTTRPGEHSMVASDWEIFLDFADAHF